MQQQRNSVSFWLTEENSLQEPVSQLTQFVSDTVHICFQLFNQVSHSSAVPPNQILPQRGVKSTWTFLQTLRQALNRRIFKGLLITTHNWNLHPLYLCFRDVVLQVVRPGNGSGAIGDVLQLLLHQSQDIIRARTSSNVSKSNSKETLQLSHSVIRHKHRNTLPHFYVILLCQKHDCKPDVNANSPWQWAPLLLLSDAMHSTQHKIHNQKDW